MITSASHPRRVIISRQRQAWVQDPSDIGSLADKIA
jgi:hypothetical protein